MIEIRTKRVTNSVQRRRHRAALLAGTSRVPALPRVSVASSVTATPADWAAAVKSFEELNNTLAELFPRPIPKFEYRTPEPKYGPKSVF